MEFSLDVYSIGLLSWFIDLCLFMLIGFVSWQEYGDSVDIDGYDIDYGVRISDD